MKYLLAIVCLWGVSPTSAQEETDTTVIYRQYDYTSKTRYRRAVRTRYGLIDFGVSAMNPAGTYRLENGIDPFETRLLKSSNFNIHLIQQRVSLAKGYLNFVYGLTWETHKYFFDNPVVLLEDTPQVEFEFFADRNFKKNRLTYSYLTIPIMFNIKTNPRRAYRSFHLSVGGFAGLLLGANFKTKEKGEKNKVRDNFGLNPWRYGLRAEIGYGPLILYGTYALNELFETDKNGGYEITPFSVGIVIWPF